MWMWVVSVWLACFAAFLLLIERAPILPDDENAANTMTLDQLLAEPRDAKRVATPRLLFIVHLLRWRVLVCSIEGPNDVS
jgi:hypothetical protein